MSYPLVRDLAAEDFPVRLICGVLGFSAQAYYAWLAEPISRRELEDAYLIDALIDAHGDDPVGEHVLDRAAVDLALTRGVFGDVGEPHLVGSGGGEDPLDVVVVHRRAGRLPAAASTLADRG